MLVVCHLQRCLVVILLCVSLSVHLLQAVCPTISSYDVSLNTQQPTEAHQERTPQLQLGSALETSSLVDDCCCEVGALVRVNHEHLRSILAQLVHTSFFKYFKLNLYQVSGQKPDCLGPTLSNEPEMTSMFFPSMELPQDCPFWVQEMLCGLQGGCSVCECDENEIPLPWKVSSTDQVSPIRSNHFSRRWTDDEEAEDLQARKTLPALCLSHL